jgi:hypothetical protein
MVTERPEVLPPTDEYICDECGETFEKGWSDEDAELERETLWGDLQREDAAIICDDCFDELFPNAYKEV